MTRALLLVVALAGALGLASTARAQAFDIETQDVTVDVSGDSIHIDVVVRALVTAPTDAVPIMLPGALTMTTVESGGVPLTLEPIEGFEDLAAWAVLPAALVEGDTLELHIVLDGVPRCRPLGSRNALCTYLPDERILFPAGPGMAWYFVSLLAADPFMATVVVRAPAAHEVVSGQGSATNVTEGGDGTRTWTFRDAVATDLLVVYSRAASVVRSTTAGASVAGYLAESGDRRETMQGIVDLAAQLFPIHAANYGELPLDEIHVLTFSESTPFAGLGLLGNVLLHELIFEDRYAYLREQGIAHELAHTWWGNLASAAERSQGGVMGEGLAEYSAWRALGTLQGEAVRIAGVRMNSVWYMLRRPADRDIAPLDANVEESPVYVFAAYHKSSSVFFTIENAVGAEDFGEALRLFVARGSGGLSARALVDDIRTVSGYDATLDLDQWMSAPGFPTITVATEPSADGSVVVRAHSEGDFAYRLPVRVHLADGTFVDDPMDVVAGDNEHTVVLTDDAQAVLVEIDPRWTLVRRIAPERSGDVTFDGRIDARDLIEVALRNGGELPTDRRVDGHYDPLYDIDGNEHIDVADVDLVASSTTQ